jgi:metal-responsive CopG/Arc/MetJ family transcriptional regulator
VILLTIIVSKNKEVKIIMTKYQGVCLPTDLLQLIEQKKRKYGFTSRSDFVKTAIREKLERLQKMEAKS